MGDYNIVGPFSKPPVVPSGSNICIICRKLLNTSDPHYHPAPDPRDARIADLERKLAAAREAFKKMSIQDYHEEQPVDVDVLVREYGADNLAYAVVMMAQDARNTLAELDGQP